MPLIVLGSLTHTNTHTQAADMLQVLFWYLLDLTRRIQHAEEVTNTKATQAHRERESSL